jgi:hypothetical protein
MATSYEGLYQFTDEMAKNYEKDQDLKWLFSLTTYYNTTLKHGKFRDQKRHCKETLKRLNKPYHDGYFNE